MYFSSDSKGHGNISGQGQNAKCNGMRESVLLKVVREQQGLCAECGAQTHTFRDDPAPGFRTKVPLTIKDKVHRGRCLVCHPLPVNGGGGGVSTLVQSNPPVSSVAIDQHKTQTRPRSTSVPRSLVRWSSAQTMSTLTATAADDSFRSLSSGVTLKRIRERQGLCAECGAQTHEFVADPVSGANTKRPLTVENEVRRGRCLHCHPLPNLAALRENNGRSSKRNNSAEKSRGNGSPKSIASSFDTASVCTELTRASAKERKSAQAEEAAVQRLTHLNADSADICDIIATMRLYPANVEIQEQGCHNLLSQSHDEEKSSAIGRVGGIPTIINAMRTHGKSRGLQWMGCEALKNLALIPYNKRIISDRGGMSAIVNAMELHKDSVGVQLCGCATLACIGTDSKDRFDPSSVLGALRVAIEMYPEEEKVLRGIYKTLKALDFKPMQVLAKWQEDKEQGR